MPTALIAEDEARLRAQLVELLHQVWPDLTIVAEAEDGPQALAALAAHSPDVLFLDIRMPGLSGIDVARAAAGRAHVVFITAYDEYAVEAFERGAVDYLLKPVDAPRLIDTVRRLRERLAGPPGDLRELLDKINARETPGTLRWIQASVGNKLRFITVDEVLYFEADSKYVRVVTAKGEATIRKPIRELAAELDPQRFWQIHRGTIVNIDAIDTVVRSDDDGRMEVRIKQTGSMLPVSETYRHRFRQM
jgi:DNA-binding LytR/AlgR family response regulator